MTTLDIGTIPTFEQFLTEDSKKISDANHHKKTGDTSADTLAEPKELKPDQGPKGTDTKENFEKANKADLDMGKRSAAKPDKVVVPKLTEGKEEGDDGDDDADKKDEGKDGDGEDE